jgi:hypothetical protein
MRFASAKGAVARGFSPLLPFLRKNWFVEGQTNCWLGANASALRQPLSKKGANREIPMLHYAIGNITPPVDAYEARRLVLKLRWIGLEEDATSLQALLLEREIGAIGPLDTD